MRSRRNRASGSEYSDKMRMMRPSGLLRKAGFSYASGARSSGCGSLRAIGGFLAFPEVNGIVHSDPDVKQPQSGDDAARDAVQRQKRQMRSQQQKSVIAPEMCPGQKDQNKSQIAPHHHPD